ncbi:uncharacterized protein LOC126677059 [Mercurialis annua]|uniref:uncharacterized protein LOC126677059 n=1 Tax=Mercurialis annua TaxID=3986 RepID=UPI00215FB0DD|nr:uncharacterized protein LOC126677059 [Mercurialis annua]
MHPHSYTLDSLSKSQELASAILSSSTASQISSVCGSIESFLHSHTPDPQSRHFFSLTFPTLICKLYGFCDTPPPLTPNGPHFTTSSPSSNGWIDVVYQSNDTDLASKVFNLLSPNGVLFQSISAVDRQSLVKYVFPVERLPEWTRLLLSSEKDCDVLNNLCPSLRGKIKEDSVKGASLYYQVQLNVFEYFMFWFAYYPIMKGNCENFNSNNNFTLKSRVKKSNLENWTKSITGLSISKRGNEQKLECNLYLRLLYAYLRAFVPVSDLGSHNLPYHSSLLHYGCVTNDGLNDGYEAVSLRAAFIVDTLVNYWLVDTDFSPLNVNVSKIFGLSFPLRSVLGETPPTPNLGEVVKLLVRYLNLSANVVKEGTDRVGSANWNRVSLSSFDVKSTDFAASVNDSLLYMDGSWNLRIQRPLYRFILRTFLFCPVETTIKNASQVFGIWISYLEPWKNGFDDFAELDSIVGELGKDVKKENYRRNENGYSSLWQHYILSNYLYYSSLVMHFIGFAHKFLHADPEVIVQMVLQVMKILTSSQELTDLIKNVDAVFHSKQSGVGKSIRNGLHKYITLIREQLQDWEDGLCESDADGSFLHENWNKDLRLFSNGEDGGQQLLQLFILRAEAELQANYGDNLAHNLQLIDSLKAQLSYLFGDSTVRRLSFTPETKQCDQSRDELFKPRRSGNQAWADVKYKGDWMKRPISDDEVSWLAKLLVWLSDKLNDSLGLNQAQCSDIVPEWSEKLNDSLGLNQAQSSDIVPKWSYVEVSSDMENVCGPTDTIKLMLCAIGSWFLALCAAATRFMRQHGLRVNLRMLASKKIVMVLLISVIFSVLKRAFGMFYRV